MDWTRYLPRARGRNDTAATGFGPTKNRRLILGTVSVIAVMAASLPASIGHATQEASRPTDLYPVSAGTSIPQASVRFSYYPCCADIGLPVVAVRKGFFKDVGVSLQPSQAYLYSSSDQIVPSMQRNTYDITILPDIGYLSTLATFGMNLPPTMLFDTYIGYAILEAPDNHAKTTADYMKQGLPFAQAAKMAVQQLRGQTVYTPPLGTTQPPYPGVMLSYGGMTLSDLHLSFLEDQKTAELAATPGRVKWAIPYSAPIMVELLRDGFRPVIDVKMILDSDPGSSQAKQLSHLVGDSATVTQRSFLEGNRDTVIRFVSAMYRAEDYVTDKATRQDGWKMVADIINATQGTRLAPADIGYIYQLVDPLFPWSKQSQLWDNPKSSYYVLPALQAQVNSLIANGTLPKRVYDLNNFMAALSIYREMVALQTQADALFVKVANLSGAKKTLVQQAHRYYQWHDYLDAVRFLKAAAS